MTQTFLARSSIALALSAVPWLSHAAGITDPASDFLPTFAGSVASADLDVVSANVVYDASTDRFQLSSTQRGAVGSTRTGFYVWGVNSGAGTAGFAANGIDGVRFNTVVILRPDGTGAVGGRALPAGSVSIVGNTITGTFSGAALASTGFASKLDYTWNLWPRDGAFSGFAAISDFAPDNANFSTSAGAVAAVPEATTSSLLALGLAGLGVCVRQRRRSGDGTGRVRPSA